VLVLVVCVSRSPEPVRGSGAAGDAEPLTSSCSLGGFLVQAGDAASLAPPAHRPPVDILAPDAWGDRMPGATAARALAPRADPATRQGEPARGIQAQPFRFLIHDRDTKFSRAFDEVFRAEGIKVIRTSAQAPNANAFAERWIRTVRAECLDRILILGRRHLERVLRVYRRHYNEHGPHRALQLLPPNGRG
jgi:hypothetical protein